MIENVILYENWSNKNEYFLAKKKVFPPRVLQLPSRVFCALSARQNEGWEGSSVEDFLCPLGIKTG